MLSLILVAALWAAPASEAGSAEPALDVISFTGSLEILSGGRVVTLKPGSPGYSLLPGSEAALLSGEAVLSCEGAVVRTGAGDSFLFVTASGRPALVVRAGAVEVTTPQGETRSYAAGELASLTSAPPAYLPAAAGPAEPLPPPSENPSSPAWDPLKTLTARLDSGTSLSLEIELHPFYRLRQVYDSNIYLVPDVQPAVGGGVTGSMVMSNELGVNWSVPLSKRHKLGGMYAFKATTFAKQSKSNNALDQSFGLNYDYEPSRESSFKAWETYANTEDPAFSEVVVRERRWQNQAGARFDHEFGRWLVVSLDGQHTIHKYLSPGLGGLLNHYEAVGGGSAGVMLGPKTKLYAAYHVERVHYTAGRAADSRSWLFDVGLEGELTEKLKGRVSGGYRVRRYDKEIAGITGRVRTWQGSAALEYAYDRRTSVTLAFNRSVNEATFSNNRYFVSTGGDLGLRRKVQRLTLGLDAGMQADLYPETSPTPTAGITARRRDDIYRGAASAEYAFKSWLAGGLSYSRVMRNSIFTREFNYVVHRTSLELRLTF